MFGRKKETEDKENEQAGRLGEAYSWLSGWYCPISECHHFHTKPHFSKDNQIDYKKNPLEVGRVKKEREEKDSVCSEETGPVFDKKGLQRPLMCPHCGWEDELIYVIKK